MENIGEPGMENRWSVKVPGLGGKELRWEYEDPADGDRDLRLRDPLTKEELGNIKSNCFSLSENISEEAVEQLIIAGEAAQIMLVNLFHNDMTIAMEGREGYGQWKYQEYEFWDIEELRMAEKLYYGKKSGK